MKFTYAAALASLAASANAHATFQYLWTSTTASTNTCVRQPSNNNPLSTSSANLACNVGGDTPAASVCSVAAGGTFAMEMHQQPGDRACGTEAIGGNHDGPTIIYMAKVSDATTAKGASASWFKVAEIGLVTANPTSQTYTWGTDTMNSNCGKVYFTIPSCLAPGDYLIRAEVIALHVAGSAGGAQLYASCAQAKVTGSGSTVPAGVSFPGAYGTNDPGILFNIYSSYTSYTIPGPAVFTCGSTSTVKPGTTTTTTKPTTGVTTSTSKTTTSTASGPLVTPYGQCGPTPALSCVSGYTCKHVDELYYWQCVPA